MSECRRCNGTGQCTRLTSLLDSAERIMGSALRNGGEVNRKAVEAWLQEKQRLCHRYPKSLREMGHAPR